jgi:hypothetical protein
MGGRDAEEMTRSLRAQSDRDREQLAMFREALIAARAAMKPFAAVAEQIPASAPDHLNCFHSRLTAADWRKLLRES